MGTYKISSVHALIYSDSGKVLLTKRNDVPIWVIPGGHVESLESPEKAIKREVIEELGINIDKFTPIIEYTYPNTIKILYKALVKDNVCIEPCSKEVREYGWFSTDNLPTRIPFHDVNKIKDSSMYKDVVLKRYTYINKRAELVHLSRNPLNLLVILLYLIKNKLTGGSFKF